MSFAVTVAGRTSLTSPNSPPALPPQPASAITTRRRAGKRTSVWWRAHAQGHVLAQRHAFAVADVPLPLQVLRVRDAQAAPALPARGGAADRSRGAARCERAPGADRRGTGRAAATRGTRVRGLRRLRCLGVRARARARAAAAH